ncbi:MAG: glycosyl transferase family 2 [Flavobacterium sp. BFFFF2]|nr:MAG: glycosyl transferase family 2 [Flavobacterium sp. BFFFF2]
MLLYIFIVFCVVCAIQLYFFLGVFGAFSFGKSKEEPSKKLPVSIIVCAKNESERVQKLVPILAKQEYGLFELVLIDDASSDDTLDWFEHFERTYSNIRIVKVENNEAFWGNKKFALTLGIKAAKYDHLLFTDADCLPASPNWLALMSRHFTPQKTIILGYGAYSKIPGSFLNKLIRYETLLTATTYLGSAQLGRPYMGVGRNLAYHRSEFFKVRGFMDHMKIRSGDDDLFINQAATAQNTTVCYDPEAFTISDPKETFSDWMYQKRRHLTTASHYKFSDRSTLGLLAISQIAFPVLAIILLAHLFLWIPVVAMIGVRYLSAWISMGFAAKKLKETDLMYLFPFWEWVLILCQIRIWSANLLSKPAQWK